MALIKQFFLVLLAVVLAASSVYSVDIAASPEKMVFENVLNYGYAEKILRIGTNSSRPVDLDISATGRLSGWIIFDPAASTISSGNPAEIKVILRPANASAGLYQGLIIINTVTEGNQMTTAVTSAESMNIEVAITDEEIEQATVRDVVLNDIEQGKIVRAEVQITNQGNLALISYFEANILHNEETVDSFASEEKTIPASSTSTFFAQSENILPLGEYHAEITVHADGMTIRKQRIPFKIVEQGMLPEEEIRVIEVYPEPVTLSASWALISVWTFLLGFIIWNIARHKGSKD